MKKVYFHSGYFIKDNANCYFDGVVVVKDNDSKISIYEKAKETIAKELGVEQDKLVLTAFNTF